MIIQYLIVIYLHVRQSIPGLPFFVLIPHLFSHYIWYVNFICLYMQKTNYSEHRKAAIAWMNSKRDFNQGIQVLETSGFRPVVVANLKKRGVDAPAAMARLKHLMRTLINAWAQPGDVWEDTDLEAGILNGKKITEDTPEQGHMSLMEAYDALNSGQLEHYPTEVKNIILDYRHAYVQREILHRELAELGEDNTEELCQLRKEKSDQMAALDSRLEELYPQFIAYVEDKKIPTPEDPAEDKASDPEKVKDQPAEEEEDNNSVDYDQMPLDDLKKLKKSLSTKVIRAVNRLRYQQETKAETENPMPDGPERVKYETKIRRLSAQIEDIKMAIAKHG